MRDAVIRGNREGPAKKFRGIVRGELRAALEQAGRLGPFTFRNRPISMENLDRLIGTGMIEAFIPEQVSDLRYRISGIGIHCLRMWKEIEGLDAKTEVDPITGGRLSESEAEHCERSDWKTPKYETDDQLDARVMETLRDKGCIVGIPNMMDALNLLNPTRIKASLYRLDEKGWAQWDITDAIYLTVKGLDAVRAAPEAGEGS